MSDTIHRSGVVAIVGPPNAGKSTLLNRILGQKIAIISHKPQTTRNRICGIVTGDTYQILLLDTPGLHNARDLMNQEMVRVALESVAEADLVLFIEDGAALSDRVLEKRSNEYDLYFKHIKVPALLALNKIDLLQEKELSHFIAKYNNIHDFDEIIPLSALKGRGVDKLLDALLERLEEGPQYYPDDIPTDSSERFIVSEMIREKVFLLLKEEIPYSTAVIIESFDEQTEPKEPVVVHASIVVERDSQKGIIIGHKGKMLAKIRQQASRDIEHLLGCPVRLHLFVKVRKNWTGNPHLLREYGMG